MAPQTRTNAHSAERPQEKSSFQWLEVNRRLIVDSAGIVFLVVGLLFVAIAMLAGKLMKLGAGDLVNAGSVLSAAGGVFIGLGSRTRS